MPTHESHPTTLSTEAWVLKGITRSIPARLSLADERLSLWSEGETLFEAPVQRIESIHSPWYYFGGGFHVTVYGQRYRLSFVVPTEERGGIADIPEGQAVCKLWVETLLSLRGDK